MFPCVERGKCIALLYCLVLSLFLSHAHTCKIPSKFFSGILNNILVLPQAKSVRAEGIVKRKKEKKMECRGITYVLRELLAQKGCVPALAWLMVHVLRNMTALSSIVTHQHPSA